MVQKSGEDFKLQMKFWKLSAYDWELKSEELFVKTIQRLVFINTWDTGNTWDKGKL